MPQSDENEQISIWGWFYFTSKCNSNPVSKSYFPLFQAKLSIWLEAQNTDLFFRIGFRRFSDFTAKWKADMPQKQPKNCHIRTKFLPFGKSFVSFAVVKGVFCSVIFLAACVFTMLFLWCLKCGPQKRFNGAIEKPSSATAIHTDTNRSKWFVN